MKSLESLQDRLLQPTIPVGFLGDALQAARFRGTEVEDLLQQQGLSLASLELPGLRVSIDSYSSVLRLLGERTDDAFFGFLSRPVPLQALPVFSYSLVGCRNLTEFISQANDFYALFSNDFRWRLERSGNDVVVAVDVNPVLPVDYRFVIQSLLLMSTRLFGWSLGEDPELKSVSFSFEHNATDESLAYLFGNRIDYGCGYNAICMDKGYAEAGLSCTRDQVALMLKEKRHLFLLTHRGNPLTQQVRRLLLKSRNEQWLEGDDVARQLNMNPNQLWRRLKKEGGSFVAIRDQIKRDWALVLLEDPANTVEWVASQLRYSDVSAFRKAFKNWTGLQPSQYRGQLQQ